MVLCPNQLSRNVVTSPDSCSTSLSSAFLFPPVAGVQGTFRQLSLAIDVLSRSLCFWKLLGCSWLNWLALALIGCMTRKHQVFLCGRLEEHALCSEQTSRRLVGHKLLVDDCSAKGLVGHSLRVTVRPNLLLKSELFHARRATSDSLLAACRGLIGFRNSD